MTSHRESVLEQPPLPHPAGDWEPSCCLHGDVSSRLKDPPRRGRASSQAGLRVLQWASPEAEAAAPGPGGTGRTSDTREGERVVRGHASRIPADCPDIEFPVTNTVSFHLLANPAPCTDVSFSLPCPGVGQPDAECVSFLLTAVGSRIPPAVLYTLLQYILPGTLRPRQGPSWRDYTPFSSDGFLSVVVIRKLGAEGKSIISRLVLCLLFSVWLISLVQLWIFPVNGFTDASNHTPGRARVVRRGYLKGSIQGGGLQEEGGSGGTRNGGTPAKLLQG